MNAFTPVIRDSEVFGATTTPPEVREATARRYGIAKGLVPSSRPGGTRRDKDWSDRQLGGQIPVFRDQALAGFVDRMDRPASAMGLASGGQSKLPRDMWMQLWIVAALHTESWIAADFVGFSVRDGLVHLSGEVDSMHAKVTLLRIAAATPGAAAIVDRLWVSCE